MGLKESVLAVEQHLAAHPTLKTQFDEAYRQQRRRSGSWMTLAWLLLMALLVLWILRDK